MDLSEYVQSTPHLRHPVLMTLTIRRVYNNPDYSDLTIVLKDGREIKAHKNILCTANVWFEKACGVSSSFVVR